MKFKCLKLFSKVFLNTYVYNDSYFEMLIYNSVLYYSSMVNLCNHGSRDESDLLRYMFDSNLEREMGERQYSLGQVVTYFYCPYLIGLLCSQISVPVKWQDQIFFLNGVATDLGLQE